MLSHLAIFAHIYNCHRIFTDPHFYIRMRRKCAVKVGETRGIITGKAIAVFDSSWPCVQPV